MMRSKNFIERIIHNPIIQTLVIFISGGWIVLEITEYFIENFGLNEAARNIVLIILISLLPIAVFIAWFSNRKKSEKESKNAMNTASLNRRRILGPAILIVLALGTTLGFRLIHKSKLEAALEITLPDLIDEIKHIEVSEGERNWIVYYKALELERILRNNPEFYQLWNDITVQLSITTDPEGARVFTKPYSRPDTTWHYLGATPLEGVHLPRGLTRMKIEKPGFEVEYDIFYNSFGYHDEEVSRHYQLYRPNNEPEGMVHAHGFKGNWIKTGALPSLEVGDFWIDRFEVNNRQYKTFVDSGGYTNPLFWDFPFVEGEDTLAWEIAMERFKDRTGWQGPANWEVGDFPPGEENFPVSGISWYEAAAYADFSKKELPTIFHWTYLSEIQATPEIIKFGNFSKKGPSEVGSNQGLTRFGTMDLPGNVSEWVFNSAGNKHIIKGGNWQEPAYWYNNRLYVSPWTRSELIGFRCMRYLNDTSKQELKQHFERTERDFSNARPVSDEAFNVMKALYKYEKGELNIQIIETIDLEHWIKETIIVDVPYEDSPMQILVYLPKKSKPPYQTVIYYPHDGPLDSNSLDDMVFGDEEFLIKSGRAFIWPVYYSNFGRGDIEIDNVFTWRQTHIYRVIDFQITCDYLQTRDDIDLERIAYYGVSWGGWMAPYICAIEDRVKLGILVLFGVQSGEEYQELDQINYLPRVTIPMLLMDGRYDFDFTLKQQQAFYDFLGTPEIDKEWKLYETTHHIPRNDLVNESLKWLDKYFGPVN